MQTSAKPTKTADFLTLFQIIPASLYAFRKRIKQKPLLFLLDWVAIPLLFVTFLGFWDKDGSLELKLFTFGIVLLCGAWSNYSYGISGWPLLKRTIKNFTRKTCLIQNK